MAELEEDVAKSWGDHGGPARAQRAGLVAEADRMTEWIDRALAENGRAMEGVER